MEKYRMPCEKCGSLVTVEPCCGASKYDRETGSNARLCEKCGGKNYYRPCGRLIRMKNGKEKERNRKSTTVKKQ